MYPFYPLKDFLPIDIITRQYMYRILLQKSKLILFEVLKNKVAPYKWKK